MRLHLVIPLMLLLGCRGRDDHPNTGDVIKTQTDLNVTGRIDYADDTDVFHVAVQPQRRITVQMKQADSDADLITRISVPGDSFDLRSPNRLVFTVQEPTTVEFTVQCGRRCNGSDLSWSLELETGIPDDASDDFFATSLVTDAVNGTGYLLDYDWFRLAPMEAGHLVQIEQSANIGLEVSELDGTSIAGNRQAFLGASRVRRLKVTYAHSPVRLPIPVYPDPSWWVRLTDLGVDQVSDTVDAASPLPVGQTSEGHFERFDDIDAFVFEAAKDHFYSISTGNPNASVTFVDESGRPFAAHAPTYVSATESRSFTLSLSLDDVVSRDGRYALLVRDLGLDESNGNIALEVPADGGVVRGAFQAPIDVDTLWVRSSASVVQVIVDTTSLVTARVIQADGSVSTHLPHPRLAFAVRPDRMQRIELQPYVDTFRPLSGVPVGLAYTVSANLVSDDFDDDIATGLPSRTRIDGRIDFEGDTDLFTFQLSVAANFTVEITGDCIFGTLIGTSEPQRAVYGSASLFGLPGRYTLRIAGDHCSTSAYSIRVNL